LRGDRQEADFGLFAIGVVGAGFEVGLAAVSAQLRGPDVTACFVVEL
jgi:hypothetical protein